jgi:hypothetical protein
MIHDGFLTQLKIWLKTCSAPQGYKSPLGTSPLTSSQINAREHEVFVPWVGDVSMSMCCKHKRVEGNFLAKGVGEICLFKNGYFEDCIVYLLNYVAK